MITVKELIQELQKEDPDRVVILSSDAEGNRHSPLAGFDKRAYVEENSWSGEVYDEDDCDLEDEKPVKAVVLFPTN